MDESKIKNVNYLTYGSIISFMLDYSDPNDIVTINYAPKSMNNEISQNKKVDYMEFFTSHKFLFSHGVFNEFCYFYQFQKREDIKNNYSNTMFLVLPALEFDSMDALKTLIKRIKQSGLSKSSESGINKQMIKDCYIKFKREVLTNHDNSLKLMKKENNTVNYNDCVQFLHLKSGKFLEYKYNNKTLKTYVQLTNYMSKKTLFRFQPAYDYHSETSTHCLFNLAIKIACGEKKAIKEKYLANENIPRLEENTIKNKSSFGKQGKIISEDEEDKKEFIKEEKKSFFDGENLKNTINAIFNDGTQDLKGIDELVTYSLKENLQQKNLGVKLMPEDNYVVINGNSFNLWRLVDFSEDYFEDINYLNLLDYFCIQNPNTNLFIHLEEVKKDDFNYSIICDNINLNTINNNNKNELLPIKEEKEEINENISDILDFKKRKRMSLFMKRDSEYIKNKNNVNDSTLGNKDSQIQVQINYFLDSNYNNNKKYKLIADTYEDKEHLKPYSLFRIEPLFDSYENDDLKNHPKRNINIISEDMDVRLINIFTDKVLYVNKIRNNQYKLLLVDDMPREDKAFSNTIFSLQQMKDTQEIDEDEDESEGEEKKDDNSETSEKNEKENYIGIKKNSFVKIYSKKYSAYIGIRLRNENNNKELILTNSMSNITKFKFNYLDEEDKYELNFFEQLLLSFDNTLNYFKNENITVTVVSQNYERIKHILFTLRLKLNQFKKGNRDIKNLNLQENKFDFLEIIQHFNIVSKLIELFLTNWFKNYHGFSYKKLDFTLSKFFKSNKDILKFKLLISREILNILSLIYELKHSYLNVIEEDLLYFFMFVGRDDKCTKFLVDILKNNKSLLLSLCPLSKDNIEIKEEPIENEENINEINESSTFNDNEEILKEKEKKKKTRFNYFKKCLLRIIKYYNNMTINDLRNNFSSFVLFFDLMSNLLILDNQPFNQFYNDYFKDLGLLKSNESNQLMPYYEENPILIDFDLIENEIYVKKIAFNDKENNESNGLINIKLNNLIDIISNYNYDTENERNAIFLAKLISLNLCFYSSLSLCDNKFKEYMKNIFKFDNLLNNYLTLTYNIIKKIPNINKENTEERKNNNIEKIKKENPLMNDLKCSIIQVLTYLYLKVPYPFTIKTHLFKIINQNINQEVEIISKLELKKIIDYIQYILNNKEEKLDLEIIDQFCLIQILELTKYTLRRVYLKKNNIQDSDRDNIYNLIINVMNLLEKYIGLSKNEGEKKFISSLNSLKNDKIIFKDPMFLVSENYQYIFLKYKNKLVETIKKQKEKGNNTKVFLNILSDICDKERMQKNKYDMVTAEMTKKNIKLLRNCNLKGVLMDISINTNRDIEKLTNTILLIIEEIILEFMEYLEFATIEGIDNEINNKEITSRKEYEDRLRNEVINKKMSTKYLDEFKKKKLNENEYSISLYFLKFLMSVENTKLKNLAIDILYKLYNGKKSFYSNMNYLVILENSNEYDIFIEIKNIFIELIQIVKNLNLIQRLDKNSILLCSILNKKVKKLLEILFDEEKWNNEFNAFKIDEELKLEDTNEYQKDMDDSSLQAKESKIDEEDDDKESENQSNKSESDIEEEEDKKNDSKREIKTENSLNKSNNNFAIERNNNKGPIFSFDSKKNSEEEDIIDTSNKNQKIQKINSDLYSNNSEGDYFLNEYDEEHLLIYQQTLYNLDFILFINEFFTYIDKLSETKSELSGDLSCLEETLISLYKILVVFITNNEINHSLIKNKLYLYICPLKLKIISSSLLYYLNYFIYHLVYKYENKNDYVEISHIDKVINRLYLLHQLDWKLHKEVMPYFVTTLFNFFECSSPEYINLIFQLLDDIKNFVTTDIINGHYDNINILILNKLIEFIDIELQQKDDKEYRNRPLLSLTSIIEAFPIMIKSLAKKTKFDKNNLKLSKPLILITNLLFDFYDPYYKSIFNENKTIILDSLLFFCHKMNIKDDFIYKNNNKKILYKYLNEFIGLSLPKLYILLTFSERDERSQEIVEKVNKFYEKIYQVLIYNEKEEIFLEEKHEEQIEDIFAGTGDSLAFLQKIVEIKSFFENSSSSFIHQVRTLDKNELKDKSRFLRRASQKRILFDQKILEKKNLINNEKMKANEKLKKIAEKEIEDERREYINKLFDFFKFINKNYNNRYNIDYKVPFYINYCHIFTKHYEKKLFLSKFFFFYWTNIYLMLYQKDKCFDEGNYKYNKEYFKDLYLIEFTIERFENVNLNYNNYENLLYIKFLDSYLYKSDEINRAKILIMLIEKPESAKLFHLMHNILNNFSSEINKDIKGKKLKKEILINKSPESIFEKDICEYNIVLQFLVNLTENNDKIKNKMKDYLRLQYNNIKNHDFIIILSNILESFINQNNRIFNQKYYGYIITIIEFLTKCCYGPAKENQYWIVNKTRILDFIKYILRYMNYRERKRKNDDRIKEKYMSEENENGGNTYRALNVSELERRKLSYLKYKLLVLLNVLTMGRKKGDKDKLFDSIHQKINFEVLEFVLIETFKEILIENKAQNNSENFTFEEKMLSRMNDLNSYLYAEEKLIGFHFIIFEIGTYAYILINTYLEILTRPLDFETFNEIKNIKQGLEKNLCEIKEKNMFSSVFKNLIDFLKNLIKCFKIILSKFGKCYLPNNNDEDFLLHDSFNKAYSFFFEYTPNIEVLYKNKILKYYVRLSPICKCLTREMKDEFHSYLDRSSAKTKTENLFNKVEFYRFQLIMNKKILDAFSTSPILNLFLNHYKFYRNIFLIVAIIINILIFMSYYRTNDDEEEVTLKTKNINFDYGFLYKKQNIRQTRIAFFIFTIIELVLAVLILVNYLIFRVSYFLYYKGNDEEKEKEKEKEKEEDKRKRLNNLAKNGEILKYVLERLGNVLLNIIKDIKLIYHLFLFFVIILALCSYNYKILSILLIDIIETSSTLMCIVKSFWIPKKQIIVTLILFYLVAYYFIIFIYLYIPDNLPTKDCFKFSNCYFTLCDQTIKNSNGIINYLTEDGLYTSKNLWENPRFWIDNWFAIFDLILVIQMFCGIIIDTFLSQKEKNKEIEEDKNNVCFICGLNKNDLNKYYSNSEKGFYEHIKLDHYLWNYMFAVFNVTIGDESPFLFLDEAIKEGYENRIYSTWVPYKKCFNQVEKQFKRQENEHNNENSEDEGEGEV